jgi:CHASE2 domain-containing sensor protein
VGGGPGFWTPRRRQLVGHLFVTATLASLFAFLETRHLVGLPDSLALRVVQILDIELPRSTWLGRTSPVPLTADPAAPVVVLIRDEYYEGAFGQRSPLDRGVLTELLERIFAPGPRLVVIDLDLSPAQISDPDELDRLLDVYAARTVLVTPVPTRTLRASKHEWMRQRCQAGIRFGLPDVVYSAGTVLRYGSWAPTIANVAHSAVAGGGDRTPASPPCVEIGEQGRKPDEVRFLSPLAPPVPGSTAPINFRAFMDVLQPSDRIFLRRPDDLGALAGRLRDRVVFLGGTYGVSDKHVTPEGVLDGVLVHAAAFYSRHRPIEHAQTWSYVFELMVGVSLSYLFHATWGWYRLFAPGAARDPISFARAALALTGNLALVAFCVLAAFAVSVAMLAVRTWLSPVPLILCIFVKTVTGYGSLPHAHAAPGDDTWWGRCLFYFRVAAIVVLVPGTLYLLRGHG